MIVLTERRVPADAASISEIRHAVVAAIPERAYDREAVALAVSEAVTNAVVHAYAHNDGDITLLVAVDGEDLVVRVQDYGSGFTADGQNGVGLGLMHALADRVCIDSRLGGTLVELIFARRLDEIPESF